MSKQSKQSKQSKCAEQSCGRGSNFDACSRVVCPMRKHITAQVGAGGLYNVQARGSDVHVVSGGFRKLPTNKE